MLNVTLYYDGEESDHETVLVELAELNQEIEHKVVLIDINSDPSILSEYSGRVPVLQVGPYTLKKPISKQQMLVALGAARDRVTHLEKIGDESYLNRKNRAQNWDVSDRIAYWISKNYMWVFNLILLLYVGIPFLAPVLMKINSPAAAKVVYTIYKPLCHQLPYRSFFLFGEQVIYPRELAHIDGLETYEAVSGKNAVDVIAAREFVGDETLGYKVALCERDVAIWGSLLAFGMVFMVSGRRIKTLPWLVWLLLGVLPMGLDGGSQLLGLLSNLPSWFPARESTPLLRVITGSLFGLTTAWFVFPMMEDNMRDTRKILTQKINSIKTIAVNNVKS